MTIYYAVAEYDSLELANIGLEVLAKQGLTEDSVSLVTRSDAGFLNQMESVTTAGEGTRITSHKAQSSTSSDAARDTASRTASGAGAGAAIATALALPFSLTTAVAPFFIAGPVAAALFGAVGGAAIGGGSAPDADRVERYRQKAQQGQIYVIVQGEQFLVDEATAGLRTTRAREVEMFSVENPDD